MIVLGVVLAGLLLGALLFAAGCLLAPVLYRLSRWPIDIGERSDPPRRRQ